MNSKGAPVWLVLLAACASPAAKPAANQSASAAPPAASASSLPSEPAESTSGGVKTAETGVFLSRLPLELSTEAEALIARTKSEQELREGLVVRIETFAAYKDLGELTRRSGRRVVNGVLRVVDLTNLSDDARPRRADKQSSFVVDFDEPALEQVAAQLTKSGPEVSPSSIEAFVNQFIEVKTYTRGFDLASQVAARREGDCTEHAVLTVALLRRFGMPARLVFGLVLVAVDQVGQPTTMMAAGHAWAETFDGKQWRIVDAALHVPESGVDDRVVGVAGLPEATRLRLVYLPINVMKNEGPGYTRALMDEAGIDTVVGIRVETR